MGAVAAITTILAAIEAGATAAGAIGRTIDALRQQDLLTPEQEAELRAQMERAFQTSRYKTDDAVEAERLKANAEIDAYNAANEGERLGPYAPPIPPGPPPVA